MAVADIPYISNRPGFWERVRITFEIIGYSRAATAMSIYGYHEEAANCIKLIKELKASY